jgi:hypothetical protein
MGLGGAMRVVELKHRVVSWGVVLDFGGETLMWTKNEKTPSALPLLREERAIGVLQ